MLSVGILVVLVAKHRHLFSCDVVQYLTHKSVTALVGRVAADYIRPAVFRLCEDLYRAVRIFHPSDIADVDPVVVLRILEETTAQPLLLLDDCQPCRNCFGIEYRLAGNAPLSQTVDHVVVLIRVFEGFQCLDLFFRQKAVILVGAFMNGCPGVFSVKKPLFQPVGNGNGVEGDDHLQVEREVRTQTDVQLVKIALLQLRGFFDPYHRDVEDGLQFLRIVQAGK